MSWPMRITLPLLATLDALTRARTKVHGWDIAELANQTGPNVYRALERLRGVGWINTEWDEENPVHGRPRRRLCWLNEEGWELGLALLAERDWDDRVRRVPAWGRRLAATPGDTA